MVPPAPTAVLAELDRMVAGLRLEARTLRADHVAHLRRYRATHRRLSYQIELLEQARRDLDSPHCVARPTASHCAAGHPTRPATQLDDEGGWWRDAP